MDILQQWVKSKSAWSFKTSETGGVGIGVWAATGGDFSLFDPAHRKVRFHFGAAGMGLSAGLRKLPHLGPFLDPRSLSKLGSISVGPEANLNAGVVYRLKGTKSPELVEDDFKGVAFILDTTAALGEAASAQALVLGCNPAAFASLLSADIAGIMTFLQLLEPRALLLTLSETSGLQAYLGVAGMIGYVA